jgi:hypothetical protein
MMAQVVPAAKARFASIARCSSGFHLFHAAIKLRVYFNGVRVDERAHKRKLPPAIAVQEH